MAEACVALVQGGHVEAGELEHNPGRVVAMIERCEWTDGTPVAVSIHGMRRPHDLPLGERAEELAGRRGRQA